MKLVRTRLNSKKKTMLRNFLFGLVVVFVMINLISKQTSPQPVVVDEDIDFSTEW